MTLVAQGGTIVALEADMMRLLLAMVTTVKAKGLFAGNWWDS